jgi:hypothetical protein
MIQVEKPFELLNNYWKVRMSPNELAVELAGLTSAELYELVEILKADHLMVYSMLSADLEYV